MGGSNVSATAKTAPIATGTPTLRLVLVNEFMPPPFPAQSAQILEGPPCRGSGLRSKAYPLAVKSRLDACHREDLSTAPHAAPYSDQPVTTPLPPKSPSGAGRQQLILVFVVPTYSAECDGSRPCPTRRPAHVARP